VADVVHVPLGVRTRGIDAALAVGGTISGTVTDEAGIPLSPVVVGAVPLASIPSSISGGFAVFGFTDPNGQYHLRPGLQAGDYKVVFVDAHFPQPTYALEWYNDKPDFAPADPVTVALGVDTPGIDATLALVGSISGTVTDAATGEPLSDICVSIEPREMAPCSCTMICPGDIAGAFAFGTTGPNGTYTAAAGLPRGDYIVTFDDCSARGYLSEIYNDKQDRAVADPVAVMSGADTPGIDAALALGGSISGTVTDAATGAPVQEICIEIFQDDGKRFGPPCPPGLPCPVLQWLPWLPPRVLQRRARPRLRRSRDGHRRGRHRGSRRGARQSTARPLRSDVRGHLRGRSHGLQPTVRCRHLRLRLRVHNRGHGGLYPSGLHLLCLQEQRGLPAVRGGLPHRAVLRFLSRRPPRRKAPAGPGSHLARCSASVGISVRLRSERLFGLRRNRCSASRSRALTG